MSRKIGIFGLFLAAPVAIATLALSATVASALTIDVSCGGETVGTITVNAQGAGKGISGDSPVRLETRRRSRPPPRLAMKLNSTGTRL